ncbi:amino acid ABC transporter permease [Corynebacterium frankenforstense]
MDALLDSMGSQLLPAFWTTVKLTVYSGAGALLLGVVLTAMRVSPIAVLRGAATSYVTIVRNTPLTLVVLFCSFGLHQNLGLQVADRESATFLADTNFRLAVLGFIAYTACFVAESLRSGVNTVHVGQAEAARSLGLDFWQVFGQVVFPQAWRAAVVPLGNTLIALTKNTTIASVIGVTEASLLMKSQIENHANLSFFIFGVFALGFLVLTLPMGLGLGRLAERWAVKR